MGHKPGHDVTQFPMNEEDPRRSYGHGRSTGAPRGLRPVWLLTQRCPLLFLL
jgi:hypothetical protein